jgi:hypothetical protein
MNHLEPEPGDTRFTAAGDIEIFDRGGWQALASLLADPAAGDRGDLGSPVDPDGLAER